MRTVFFFGSYLLRMIIKYLEEYRSNIGVLDILQIKGPFTNIKGDIHLPCDLAEVIAHVQNALRDLLLARTAAKTRKT